MTKITKTLIALLVCSTVLLSCKKDYTCTCNMTYNIPPLPEYSDQTSSGIKAKKKDAENACNDVETNIKNGFATAGTVTGSCVLTKD